MTKKPAFPTQERQPDPQPPSVISAQAPSLLLYFILTTVAIFLIIVAFTVYKPDWPGLLVNLASGLIGAVIILIFVDQRLRASELRAIQQYAETSAVRLASLFSRDMRSAVSYAKVFRQQLQRIRPDPYLERPSLETLLDEYSNGFVLYGKPGTGKSTLVQVIAAKNAEEVVRHPKRTRVPILFPIRLWTEDSLLQRIWEEICKYYPMKRKVFDRWLEEGRVTIIFDGLNEHWQPALALKEIKELRNTHPRTTIIVSSRDLLLSKLSSAVDNLGLPKVEMPGLTEEEAKKLLGLMRK